METTETLDSQLSTQMRTLQETHVTTKPSADPNPQPQHNPQPRPLPDAQLTVKPSPRPIQLGRLTVNAPIMLSPMAGVTNWPFRVLCREYGPDGLYVAEMVTARALVAHNPKALRLCRFAPSERIRSLQLYGVNPGIVAQAARMVVDGDMADHVDLNFGCPVPKVTRHGGGSALPWKIDLFTELVRRVVAVCEPTGIPVTAKLRLGPDREHMTFLEAAHIAQEEGCAAITLHARTMAEYYGGHASWDEIALLVNQLSIPVFGNGDIFSADDAARMFTQTGCAGVALGRGCQGRPWLFAELKHMLAGDATRQNLTLGEVGAVIERHLHLLVVFYDGDESRAVRDLRKHIAWYLKGFPVGGAARRAFMECASVADVERELRHLDITLQLPETVQSAPRGRTGSAKKVHLPHGWLDSRTTSEPERVQLFGSDPMDASY